MKGSLSWRHHRGDVLWACLYVPCFIYLRPTKRQSGLELPNISPVLMTTSKTDEELHST